MMKENIPNNLEVGERIRKIREDLHMTRERFSELIDISDVFLGQIERGERSLSLKTLCKIVGYTGVSTDYVLFGDTKNNSTRNKINRILDKSSDTNVEYMYQMINCSNSFLKSYYKSLQKKPQANLGFSLIVNVLHIIVMVQNIIFYVSQ